ncbi:hypothetical protein, partial [Aquisphaera insulae]|uniref:hypothetical protein n=1 Tax=Aquisphaera insulae TaxID=2712864 RepID=UPI0013EB265F
MASVLAINGSVVNRGAARIVLNRLTLSMDGPGSLEFTELVTTTPGSYRQGWPVTLTVDGTLRFTGVIVSLHPSGIGSGPISVGYRCLDLTWLANQIPITASDGTGTLTFNLPSTDDDYVPSLSGLSIGDILKRLYDGHAAQLAATGITGGYDPVELAALTAVPTAPVVLQGRLWNAVVGLLAQWCNKYGSWISADGVIHHPSLLSLPTTTLTLDGDPVVLDDIAEAFLECYTRVVLRGGPWVEAAYLSLADGLVAPRWTAAEQAAWTISDFLTPKGAYELGTVTSMSSTTL